VVLAGTVAAEPVERRMPSGDKVSEIRLSVPEAGKLLPHPVAVWHTSVGKRALKGIAKGDDVLVYGTLARRFLSQRGRREEPDGGGRDRDQEAGAGGGDALALLDPGREPGVVVGSILRAAHPAPTEQADHQQTDDGETAGHRFEMCGVLQPEDVHRAETGHNGHQQHDRSKQEQRQLHLSSVLLADGSMIPVGPYGPSGAGRWSS
jgi:hypothetical protein